MLKKLSLIALFSMLMVGCGFLGDSKTEETKPANTTTETNTEKPEEKVEIKEGDTVVARWSGNSYYEGKVESIDGSKMKIGWLDRSKSSDVDKSDIYEIPKTDAKPDVAAGDMVLAKVSSNTYWSGAEVAEINGDVYVVKAVGSSSTKNVDGNKIIKISAAIAANFKDKAESSDFLKDAQSKSPAAPEDFKAKVGDKVLALWSTYSWYSGKVTKVDGDKITVAWDDNTKPKEVDAEKVLPFPSASNVGTPTADQYVLVKPTSGTKWSYAQTVSVENGSIEVKDASGKTRTMKAGEVVPLS